MPVPIVKITNHTDYVIAGVLNDVHLQISISKCVFYIRDISYFYAVFTPTPPKKLFVLAYNCQVTVAKSRLIMLIRKNK